MPIRKRPRRAQTIADADSIMFECLTGFVLDGLAQQVAYTVERNSVTVESEGRYRIPVRRPQPRGPPITPSIEISSSARRIVLVGDIFGVKKKKQRDG